MKKKILLTGANGQLGLELQRTLPDWADLRSFSSTELDICQAEACIDEISAYQPDWIINAAAYTDVEAAEIEANQAMRVNRDGVENLAKAARKNSAKLLHISTDFVFDGSQQHPYIEEDEPNPLNHYGQSKLAGEEAVKANLFDGWVIIRTSWLYSPRRKNFVNTILRLLKEKPFLNVIDDQIGVPTSVRNLSHVIYKAAELDLNGLFHWCDAGQCSWHAFACEIQNQALELGLISEAKEIKPIAARDFPAKAQRPAWSVMSQRKLAAATHIDPLPWQNELKLVLQRLGES
jgi:dTDP-4-dehydrorhamnose reductase